MSTKLKALSLGLTAVIAMCAFAVVNAVAESGGHVVSDATTANTTVVGTENTTHHTDLIVHGLSGEIGCSTVKYHAQFAGTTAEDLTVIPVYEGCTTTGTETKVPVDVNGCTYTFTVTKLTTSETEQKVHLLCPTGKKIELTHPNCTASIDPQTVETGVTYTDKEENGKKYITLDTSAKFNVTAEGLCALTGTNKTETLLGSATVKGFNTGVGGAQVNLTAT
jgi:hypothetical protein